MNSRVTGILVLALLISGGATYLVYRVVSKRAAQAAVQTTPVVLAAKDLGIGTILKNEDLKMGTWNGAPAPGMVTKIETVVGRGVVAPIYAGETMVENRLAAPGAGGGLAATIPPGMRAVAVRVNDVVGVAGFVVPGMRVDVLISGQPPGQGQNNPKVKTLLQNIEVLSAGQNFQKDAEGKPVAVQVVNLLVNPEQAEVLSLASNETRIQLVLRNPLDTQPATVPGTYLATIYGEGSAPKPVVSQAAVARPKAPAPKAVAPPPPPAPKPQMVLVEVLNGSRRTEAKFSKEGEEQQ